MLVLRCSVEDVAPETLRVHITSRTDLSAGVPREVTFATVEEASRAVHLFLTGFAQRQPPPEAVPA